MAVVNAEQDVVESAKQLRDSAAEEAEADGDDRILQKYERKLMVGFPCLSTHP